MIMMFVTKMAYKMSPKFPTASFPPPPPPFFFFGGGGGQAGSSDLLSFSVYVVAMSSP